MVSPPSSVLARVREVRNAALDVQDHVPFSLTQQSACPLQGDVRYSKMTAHEEGDEQNADSHRQSVAVHVQEPAGVMPKITPVDAASVTASDRCCSVRACAVMQGLALKSKLPCRRYRAGADLLD